MVRKFLRGEPCHILDKAENRFFNALVAEHVHTFFHVRKSYVLRSCNNHCALHRDVMYEADVDVARSRRHIYEQEVQFAPAHLQNHLLEGIACHRASPDKGLLR